MSGLTDKLSGNAKQAAGNVTGDDKLKREGKMEEVKGSIKDKINQAVDAVGEKVDEARSKSDSHKNQQR